MNRLQRCFNELKAADKKALIPFVTAGDPNMATTEKLMHALVASGADIIELGVPFSDPMADGPVIQRASERALKAGTTVSDVLDLVARFRQKNAKTPVILMGYLNPIEATGYDVFMQRAQVAGVDGLLTVDLPVEEAVDLLPLMKKHLISPIFLAAPTTTERRMKKICADAQGFIYYVSLKGVTGTAAGLDVTAVEEKVTLLRQYTDLPVVVGFGIKDGETAAAIGKISDGVVVGSALVKTVEKYGAQEGLLKIIEGQVSEIRVAMDTITSDVI